MVLPPELKISSVAEIGNHHSPVRETLRTSLSVYNKADCGIDGSKLRAPKRHFYRPIVGTALHSPFLKADVEENPTPIGLALYLKDYFG
jgi:hypothetical protein